MRIKSYNPFNHPSICDGEDAEYYQGIVGAKSLLDGREVHLCMMIFNLRLQVTDRPHGLGYQHNAYCYRDEAKAWAAFEAWDGTSVPTGWIKSLATGEYDSLNDPEYESAMADKALQLAGLPTSIDELDEFLKQARNNQ